MNPQDPDYAEKPYEFDPATMQDDRLGQTAVSSDPDPDAPDTSTPREHVRQGNDATNATGQAQGERLAEDGDADAAPVTER